MSAVRAYPEATVVEPPVVQAVVNDPHPVSHPTAVPNNYIARLMYYLQCVKNCVDINISPRLLHYEDFHVLADHEKRDVVQWAHRFRPGALRNTIFFEVANDNYMVRETANTFLLFDDPVVIGSFHLASNAITVDGVRTVIRKVMVYKHAWLVDYFLTPFTEEKWRIGLGDKPVTPLTAPATKQVHGVTKTTTTTTTGSGTDGVDVPFWCASGAICCFFFPIVGLALLTIGTCRACCEAANRRRARTTTYTTVY